MSPHVPLCRWTRSCAAPPIALLNTPAVLLKNHDRMFRPDSTQMLAALGQRKLATLTDGDGIALRQFPVDQCFGAKCFGVADGQRQKSAVRIANL